MGIWDFISGQTDSLKRNAPDLSSFKKWCPTPGSPNMAPDVTAVYKIFSTVYGYGSATVTQYLSDEEARSKILRLGTNILKHSTIEGLKAFPGGWAFAELIRDLNKPEKQDVKALQADLHRLEKEVRDNRKVHELEVDVKALQADVLRLENELGYRRKPHEQVQMDKPAEDLKSPNTPTIHSVANQSPEDVIRVFMMKGFMGRKFLDDLIDPCAEVRKK